MEELIVNILLTEEYKVKCFDNKFIDSFILYLEKNHPEIHVYPLNDRYTTILRNLTKNIFPYIGIYDDTFYVFYGGSSLSKFIPNTLTQKQFEKFI